jgi:hypothetical protein
MMGNYVRFPENEELKDVDLMKANGAFKIVAVE